MAKHSNLVQTLLLVFLFVFLVFLVSACDSQSRGFALPSGDANQGKINFVAFACNECHSIAGAIEKLEEGNDDIHLQLGGPTTRVKTYGDLVASIINPSHKISGYYDRDSFKDADGNSKMRIYNEIMTVQQLIDLTTYLETTYDVIRPEVMPMYGP